MPRAQSGRNEIIRIWSRRSTILPQFVGLTFGVYNGHKFLPVQVNENMVGHKFGEFSPTRTFTGHAGDKRARRVMSKPSHPRGLADTEAQAIVSNLRVVAAQAQPGCRADPQPAGARRRWRR